MNYGLKCAKGEYIAIREMRKHISAYTKNMPNSSEFRGEINKLDSKENPFSDGKKNNGCVVFIFILIVLFPIIFIICEESAYFLRGTSQGQCSKWHSQDSNPSLILELEL